MVQRRAMVTMADQWKVVYGLSNCAIFNDPYPWFQGHAIFDTEYLRNGTIYTDIVSMEY